MLHFKVFLLLSIYLLWVDGKLDKYCSVCEDHTMCKFHGIGEECKDVGEFGVSEADKNEILDVHNWLRKIIATGYESRGLGGPQPKAANLMKFTWDDELAKVAQRWADQCRFQHDSCRNDPRWKVGQNIYWKWKYPHHEANWTEAIMSWYDEVSLYNPNDVETYQFEASTGHYTQILWHDTHLIGCGRRDYGQSKIYVCNYGPAGNWVGEPLYEIGEPCSKCPKGTVCEENLCVTKEGTTSKPENEVTETNGIGELGFRILSANVSVTTISPPSKEKSNSNETNKGDSKSNTKSNKVQQSQIKPETRDKILNLLLGSGNEQSTHTNKIDDEPVELDVETVNGIEEIKLKIEKLIQRVVHKLRSNHSLG